MHGITPLTFTATVCIIMIMTWLTLFPPPAKPPIDITAKLKGTELTVSWKEPVVGGTPTSYIIYYLADPEDEEGNKPVPNGCTNEKDGLCSFVVTGVEANAARYNVTMVTHTKDSTMSSTSPRSAVHVAVRQSEPSFCRLSCSFK